MEPNKDVLPNANSAEGAVASTPAEVPLAEPPKEDPTDLDMPAIAPPTTTEPKPYTITPSSKTIPQTPDAATPDMSTQPVLPAEATNAAVVSAASAPESKGDDKAVFGFGGMVPVKAQKRWNTKKIILLVGGVVAILALLAGAAFAFYLPNTPDQVWNTAMSRTGEGIDTVVQKATEPSNLRKLETSKITGSVTAKMADSSYTGDFSTTFDAKSLTGDFNVVMKSADTSQKLTAKIMSQKPESSLYPDVYFQLTGIKTLGLDSFMPGISDFDSKWIVIKSDAIKGWSENIAPSETSEQPQLTSAEIAEVARSASSVTKDYLFSTDQSKAVIEKRSYVGKETVDGLSTYHYKAGVNPAHAEAYCKALANALYTTDAYKKLTGASAKEITDAKQGTDSECANVRKSINSTDEYDVWVDGKYKLIHKVRIPEKGNKANYTEIGQNYKGGDDLSLFVNFHDATSKSDGQLTLDTNIATNNTKVALNIKGTGTSNPYTISATLSATMSNDAVKVTVPTGAIPITDVLKKLGIDSPATTSTAAPAASTISPTQIKAQDSERQADINALRSYIDAYFAQNGSYPTLNQLNDLKFRQANLAGLEASAFLAPGSTTNTLASAATATQYGYAGKSCSTTGCTSYMLSAMLSTGVLYSRSSS